MKHYCKTGDYTEEEFREQFLQCTYEGFVFAIEKKLSCHLHNLHIMLESNEECTFWMHIGSVYMSNDVDFAVHSFVNQKVSNNQKMFDRIKENMKRYLR